jgi:hypothetical protein
VESIDLGEHSICTELDTSITLRNDGCEDLTISDAVLNGTGFSIQTLTNPIVIAAKSSHTFPLHSYIDTVGKAVLSSAEIIFHSDAENSLAPIKISRSYRYPVTLSFAIECDTSDDPFAPIINIKVSDPTLLVYAALEKLDVKLIFNSDLLEMRKVSGSNTYQTAGTSSIEIRGSPITCDNEGVIASIQCLSYLSDSTASQIVFSTLTPSRGTAPLDSCSVLFSSTGTSYQRPYECGDSMLIQSMRYMKPSISIVSLQPNPASSHLKATITSSERNVIISIRNYLGETVLIQRYTIRDTQNIMLDISSIPEGLYRVEVSNRVSSTSKTFVVVR